jgi:anti-sigma factor RsiW
LFDAEGRQRGARPPGWVARLRQASGRLAWRGPVAGFAAGLFVALWLLPTLRTIEFGPAWPTELVASHVRALHEGTLVQVASSDRHTVKPWYQGKLDYSPPVLDLAAQGFPLIGGRVEKLHGTPTAALVYRHDKHLVDLFVWPSEAPRALSVQTLRGFNIVRWSDGAMQFWAVSDLETRELEQLAALIQAGGAPSGAHGG